VDAAVRALYASDASNYRVLPAAVVAPATVDELAMVVGLAGEAGVPITVRGAGTSLAGNAIGGGLLVDVARHLHGIASLDPDARSVTALPGTILDDVNAAVAVHGLRVAMDPSTHSRCTLGGMVGNDACGAHSVAWGTTAENVLELGLITADGVARSSARLGPALDARLRSFVGRHTDLLRAELPPWPRRVSGYALDWLLPERGFEVARALTGTEGTCAVVSSVTLRLVAPPAATSLLVLGFGDDVDAAAAVPSLLLERPLTVESLDPHLLPGGRSGLALPAGEAWLLVDAGGDDRVAAREHAGRLAGAIGRRLDAPDVAVIEDAPARARLWRVREDGAGRASRLPDGTQAWPGFEDPVVPPERLAAFLADLRALLRDHGLQGVTYGHFGEGCVHLRVGFGLHRPGGEERLRRFTGAAADVTIAHGGSLSGEHGDGRARGELLARQFSPAMIAAFGEWKAIWDPADVLNPGVIVRPAPLTLDLRRPLPTLVAPSAPGFAFHDDGGDLRDAVERCIGVGRCVSRQGHETLCPSYRATGEERHSTRGRARLLQELMAGSLAPEGWRSDAVDEALDLCLACRACATDCPTGVDMASYRSEFLPHRYRGRLRPRSHYLLGRLPAWLGRARRVPGGARLVNAITAFPPTRRLAAVVGGMAGERRIPRLARRPLTRLFEPAEPAAPSGRQVLLWPDTFTNHLAPEVGLAAGRVLGAAGFDVALPGADVCCALTWIATGQLDHATAILRRTLRAPGVGDGTDPIVVLEPSCATTLRRDLVELLPDDPRAAAVAARIVTFAELLDGAGWAPPPAPDGEAMPALVQPHCHQQAILGMDADARVMAAAGIEPTAVLSGCCGLAGSFGAEAGHETITRAVAELELLPALRATDDSTTILADGFSCRTQVAFLDGRRARHLAEVLAARLPPPPQERPAR
jgi:FAD/FMN-containing dehydrogenase/Fe-S oxidoreductase